MSEEVASAPLLEQDEALDAYLRDLLAGAVPPAPAAPPSAALGEASAPPAAASGGRLTPGGCPSWAETPFQVLRFDIGGLQLALPLFKVVGIYQWPQGVGQLAAPRPGIVGLADFGVGETELVDPYELVVGRPPGARQFSKVVVLTPGTFGLACRFVERILTLSADDVHWRSAQTRRPWLLGTAVQHQCALVDVDVLLRPFASAQMV